MDTEKPVVILQHIPERHDRFFNCRRISTEVHSTSSMYKVFVDLDGVLVDFEAGVRRVTGKMPDEQSIRSMWSRLAVEPGFYEHLEWMPDGADLWERVRGLQPTILTGLPWGNWAKPQKIAWCARELGPDVPVVKQILLPCIFLVMKTRIVNHFLWRCHKFKNRWTY